MTDLPTPPNDLEMLSRMMAGELSEAETEALLERVDTDGALGRAWRAMQALPGELGALDGAEAAGAPEALDWLVLEAEALRRAGRAAPADADKPRSTRIQRGAYQGGFKRFSRRWGAPAAIAASIALALFLMRPGPAQVLVSGSQFVDGHATLLAADRTVEVTGRALVTVEPPEGALREGGQEVSTMDKSHLLAALAGSAVTVAVYAGSATISGGDDGAVVVNAGEVHRAGPVQRVSVVRERGGDGADGAGGPAQVATRVQVPADASAREKALMEQLAALATENEGLKMARQLDKGRIEGAEGRPVPWPDDVADAFRDEPLRGALESLAEELGVGELIAHECNEFPCVSLVRAPAGMDPDAWQERLEQMANRLQDEHLGGDANGMRMISHANDGETDLLTAGLVFGPEDDSFDENTRNRAAFRAKGLMEGAQDELMGDDGGDGDGGSEREMDEDVEIGGSGGRG